MATVTTVLSEIEDEKLMYQKLAGLSLPPGVHFDHFELTDDSMGDLVWRIKFSVSKQTALTREFIREISETQQRLRLSLYAAGVSHRPSTHLLVAE